MLFVMDRLLILAFACFCVTSLVFEMFIVFDVDLVAATDPVGRIWYWYASSFDPIFLDTPLWLRVMCAIDAFVFGPFYLVLIYAFVRRREWIRLPALCYVSAIVYSTVVYFAVELIAEAGRADLLWVVVINIPYTLVPLVVGWRVWRSPVFESQTT